MSAEESCHPPAAEASVFPVWLRFILDPKAKLRGPKWLKIDLGGRSSAHVCVNRHAETCKKQIAISRKC